METSENVANIYQILNNSYTIYKNYEWLLNSYVLDYFTDEHWKKLSPSWKLCLDNSSAYSLAELLDYHSSLRSKVLPLSILTLKSLLKDLSISRTKVNVDVYDKINFTTDPKLLKIFWKNVKIKKQHEISLMSKMCYKSALDKKCFYIVDIGSGLGHLSRILCYGYGINVCAIEAQMILSNQAGKLDADFENILNRMNKDWNKNSRIAHINKRIESDITATDFLELIQSAFRIDNKDFEFGMVGLHPCGDLCATLLRLYNECPNAKFINCVGCCYMKLTTPDDSENYGFPLSNYCKTMNHSLNYHSREIACHAIENYIDKLKQGEVWKLKIHTWRATIEKIITQKDPNLKHSALGNIKYVQELTFEQYCEKALKKLKLVVSKDEIDNEEIRKCLLDWKNVVVFYSLRLIFAPLIESIILLDRLLYISENGSIGSIIPVFDPNISPRNHVLSAQKIK